MCREKFGKPTTMLLEKGVLGEKCILSAQEKSREGYARTAFRWKA
jgi:hypothetical protein